MSCRCRYQGESLRASVMAILKCRRSTVPSIVSTLCGLPFAGKSTVARQLAAELGAPIVRLDDINAERGLGRVSSRLPLTNGSAAMRKRTTA
jgi:hypothetical protein